MKKKWGIPNDMKRYLKLKLQRYILSDLKDSIATQKLYPLLSDRPYIPWTESSLSPAAICKVLNDIIINDRSTLVEFGSGISSLIIGLAIKKNDIKGCNLVSFEHDKEWFNKVQIILRRNEVADCVSVKHAPLRSNPPYSWSGERWYDIDSVEEHISGRSIDLLLVDGPPAYESENAYSRYPAVPLLEEMFSDRYSIFLDDINRKSERQIARAWGRRLGLCYSEKILGENIAVFQKGKSYNI